MATLHAVAERFRNLDLHKEAMDLLVEEQKEVLDLNRDQLRRGFTKDGTRIKKYRSRSYAKRKQKINPAPGFMNPDYKLTGKYWEGFRLKVLNSKEYEIFSVDSKAKDLEKRDTNANLYGMANESRDYFVRTHFRSLFIARVKNTLKL